MAGKFTVTIEGGEELKRRLEAMGDKGLAIAKEAIVAGAEIVREEASRRAPRRTGKLSRSIEIEVMDKSRDSVSVAIGPNKDAFYGLFLELGTSKMAARPFLVPALKATKKQVQEVVSAALRRGLGL